MIPVPWFVLLILIVLAWLGFKNLPVIEWVL